MTDNTSLTKRLWFLLLLFGFSGQLAWAVENMYFNMFIYDTIVRDTHAVTVMVQASGITASVATLLAGALSDRVGNRRLFISVGYLVWGVVIGAFAFISRENTARLLPTAGAATVVGVTVAIVVVMDCVMTLFGSSANDAAFNAWVTDVTQPSNRGRVESVLSVLPLFAMLVVAGGFGLLVQVMGGYGPVFCVLGGLVFFCGLLGLLLLRDSPCLAPQKGRSADIFYGFRPSFIRTHKILYILLFGVCVYSVACQVFFPYLLIYLEHYLRLDTLQYSLVMGAGVVLAAVAAGVFGRRADRCDKTKALFWALGIFIAGLVLMYASRFTAYLPVLIFMSFVMITGYVLLLMLFNAQLRDYTPAEAAGKVQGVRIVFYVLIPMFVGPLIGDNVIRAAAAGDPSAYTYYDAASASTAFVPSSDLFLWAAGVAALTIIPLFLLRRRQRAEGEKVYG